jgi:hypothetical protein
MMSANRQTGQTILQFYFARRLTAQMDSASRRPKKKPEQFPVPALNLNSLLA